ncbi:uncharacterized protein LACBIDRAFT_334125 [Laccaria bicolor S238N-H82]|uniref:Predicted protein n=1 Tax=Laccaria bicolor (strain S238N-H82 / ATCC MYA-4686) TaxID=486041 RepID=B0DY60_LACBS|nr:uncharacterized protein LACBIDRAFT_334125 [Laccaria bicolor S238N-H82]EDR00504.1 predicted protein [Laccaria bicolor S238N-H82]|eukprot:XP_001888896.1 predicted protein [Laccaria bicolor S238N-H82]
MAGFLRRKNKQPATVVDATTTTTTKTKGGGTPPLFARFATTKNSDDVPRIVSSPMSLAASNRGGGGGNDPRGIVVTVPSAKPAPSRAPSLPNQSTYSLQSSTQRARPPGPPPTYTTQQSAARAWRSSLVGLEDKPLPSPNGNVVGTSQPPLSFPSSPTPPTRSLPLPPSSQSQTQLNPPGLSAYTHNASSNASSQTLAPHASGSRLDVSDLRASSRSSREMEKEGSGGASGSELAPEFAMFQEYNATNPSPQSSLNARGAQQQTQQDAKSARQEPSNQRSNELPLSRSTPNPIEREAPSRSTPGSNKPWSLSLAAPVSASREGEDERVSSPLAKSQSDHQPTTNTMGNRASSSRSQGVGRSSTATATAPPNAFNVNVNTSTSRSASASATTPRPSSSRALPQITSKQHQVPPQFQQLHVPPQPLQPPPAPPLSSNPLAQSYYSNIPPQAQSSTASLPLRKPSTSSGAPAPVQGKARIFTAMAATVDIGDAGGVGVVSSPPSSSGHGQEKRGGMGMVNGQQQQQQQRMMNGQQQQQMSGQQRSMGNRQQQTMGNGQQQTMMNGMDRGQLGQQQGMDARQLAQRMGSQQLGNGMGYQQQQQQMGNGMVHHQPMNGMGQQPQNGIHPQNGVGRQGHGFIITNQQQNVGVDLRQQQQHFPPQKPNAPGPPISFHYPPQDPHGTPRTRTASTGSIRPLPQQPPQTPPRTKKLSKTRNGPDRSSTATLHTNDGSNASVSSSSMQHKFVGRSALKSAGGSSQVQRPTTPQKSSGGRPTTPSTHRTVRPTTPQTQKSTTPARPVTPAVVQQVDEDTMRNAGIELDDDPFARVEGVRMLKPKKGKARSVDDGETVDGHGQGYEEVESVSSHAHHQREPAGVSASPEDVKRAKREARRLERERERERERGREKEKGKERNSDAGTDATLEHEEAEEPVSSYYFNLAELLSHHQVVRNLLEYTNFYEWCILSSISKEIRILLVQSPPLREEVLERFLKTVGYGRWGWDGPEPLSLSLQDLSDYMRGVSIPPHEYTRVANMYIHSLSIHPSNRDPSLNDAVRSLVASTRGYTRVVLRLRAQAEKEASIARTKPLYAPAPLSSSSTSASASRSTTKVNTYGSSNGRGPVSRPSSRAPSPTPSAFSHSHSYHGHGPPPPPNSQPQGYPLGMTQQAPSQTSLGFRSPLFRLRRAPLLRVFVPSIEGDWLSDKSVQECEEECKRAGVRHLMRVGDVVWDVAVGDEGNVGRLVWDGSYLIDLDYTYSPVGELPKYLPALAFPPSYFHRVLRSGPTVSNPIMHIDISPWGEEIAANLQLLQDRIRTETPQGAYHNVPTLESPPMPHFPPPSVLLSMPFPIRQLMTRCDFREDPVPFYRIRHTESLVFEVPLCDSDYKKSGSHLASLLFSEMKRASVAAEFVLDLSFFFHSLDYPGYACLLACLVHDSISHIHNITHLDYGSYRQLNNHIILLQILRAPPRYFPGPHLIDGMITFSRYGGNLDRPGSDVFEKPTVGLNLCRNLGPTRPGVKWLAQGFDSSVGVERSWTKISSFAHETE